MNWCKSILSEIPHLFSRLDLSRLSSKAAERGLHCNQKILGALYSVNAKIHSYDIKDRETSLQIYCPGFYEKAYGDFEIKNRSQLATTISPPITFSSVPLLRRPN